MPRKAIILTPIKRLIVRSVADGKAQSIDAKEFDVSRNSVSKLMMVMKMQKSQFYCSYFRNNRVEMICIVSRNRDEKEKPPITRNGYLLGR